ncbi:MAG: hypothetical protein HQK58_12555, partial [Deltaproteobacteria bacterium]|nr:hypothetical protein [Deltaproteobacteria bacterium]
MDIMTENSTEQKPDVTAISLAEELVSSAPDETKTMNESEDDVEAVTSHKKSSRLDNESVDDSVDQDELEDTDSDDQLAFNDQVI